MQPLQSSAKYQAWKSLLEKNGVTVNAVTELHTIRKRNGEILFALLNIDAHAEGTPLLPVVMLRGHFVSVVTWLEEMETGKRRLLLVAQRRVANGALMYEHPAGMMDEDADPWLVACKEVEEETGITITRDQLQQLWPEVLYSSPGLLDEGGWFFGTVLKMPAAQIQAFNKASSGHASEGEFIHTLVVDSQQAVKLLNNTNALLGLALWAQFEGKNAGLA